MKRIISLLLMIVMLVSAMITTVSANEYGLPFTDLKENAWYMDSIAFCYEMDIVNGMTATKFVPNGTLTRAQFVQILSQLDGTDLSEYENGVSGFDDVAPGHWYNKAVVWAVEQEFVKGLSQTRFGPNEPITREQLARLLYVYAESLEIVDTTIRNDLSAFSDADKVSDWATECVQWAVEAGIISGMTETTIAPRATATRAQACRMIEAFYEYIMFGNRDTSGAFRAIADYCVANGVADEGIDGIYYVTEESEEDAMLIIYEESSDLISFSFMRYPYTEVIDGEEVSGYRENVMLVMFGLEPYYEIYYVIDDETQENIIGAITYLEKEGLDTVIFELNGYDETTAIAMAEEGAGRIVTFIQQILADTEYTLDDMFTDEEIMKPVSRSDAFKKIAEHVVTEGAVVDDGFSSLYELVTEEDGKRIGVSYDPNFESLVFFFEADPYEEVIEGESYVSYARGGYLWIDESAAEYEYSYACNVYEYIAFITGYIGNGSYTEEIFEYDGEEEYRELAVTTEAQDRLELVSFMNKILLQCDLTPDQLFFAE